MGLKKVCKQLETTSKIESSLILIHEVSKSLISLIFRHLSNQIKEKLKQRTPNMKKSYHFSWFYHKN